MRQPSLSVFVLANRYLIIDSPDRLTRNGKRCSALVDHDDKVIWIDPDVSPAARQGVILRAVSLAWQDRVAAMQLVQ